MKDLSILIPARNEMFLAKTIENVLENIEGNTEIIVVLDGALADPPIKDDPRVKIIYHQKAVGQRAATNDAARLSDAKYVMKLDAHCAVDKGFDVKMMAEMKDDYTLVPKMYNLHAFDWVCECGYRRYQGPTEPCSKCGKDMKREMIWKPKPSPETTSMRFDKDLRFAYWGEYKNKQKGDLVETMSLLGACWMLTREKYWELDISEETFGSWGQQGTEVACKTWLSGGKLLVNKKTWFAHMFRTQGKDFGFPYEQSNKQIQHARDYSKELFLKNKWPKAKYPLSWLIGKFNPPDWESSKGIVYYTTNQLNLKIARKCQNQLKKSGLPITSVSLKPMPHFGENIHLDLSPSILTMFRQILTGLEGAWSDSVFLCEHDVLYHPSHFEFTPPRKDVFYFNTNVWKWNTEKGYGVKVDDCKQVSGMCCSRELAIKFYREKIKQMENGEFDHHYEPQENRESWQSEFPNIDIRHERNLTANRWSKDEFKNQKYTQGWIEKKEIPDWGIIKI